MSSSIALRRSPKPGALTAATLRPPRSLFTTSVASASPSTSSAMIRSGLPVCTTGFQHRQQRLQARQLLLVQEDVGIRPARDHLLGIGDEVRREVAAVELHALDDVELGVEALGLLHRDHAFSCRPSPSRGRSSRRSRRSPLAEMVPTWAISSVVLDLLRLASCAGRWRRWPRPRGRCRASGPSGSCRRRPPWSPRARSPGPARSPSWCRRRPGHRTSWSRPRAPSARPCSRTCRIELDLLGDGDAVLGDARGAERLVDHDVAALRAQRHLDRIGEDVDAAQHAGARVGTETNVLGSHGRAPCWRTRNA
jgi:hypothetical protein